MGDGICQVCPLPSSSAHKPWKSAIAYDRVVSQAVYERRRVGRTVRRTPSRFASDNNRPGAYPTFVGVQIWVSPAHWSRRSPTAAGDPEAIALPGDIATLDSDCSEHRIWSSLLHCPVPAAWAGRASAGTLRVPMRCARRCHRRAPPEASTACVRTLEGVRDPRGASCARGDAARHAIGLYSITPARAACPSRPPDARTLLYEPSHPSSRTPRRAPERPLFSPSPPAPQDVAASRRRRRAAQ